MIRLFRVFVPKSVLGLLLTEFSLAFACYVGVAVYFEDLSASIYLLYDGGIEKICIAVLSIIIGLYFNDLYSNLRVLSRVLLVQQFCLAIGIAFILQALLSYADPEIVLPRWHMIVGSAIALIVLPSWRIAYAYLSLRILGRRKVLFLGCNEILRDLGKGMAHRPEFGLESIGYLSDYGSDEDEDTDTEGLASLGNKLGNIADLRAVYADKKPDMIIVGPRERRGSAPMQLLLELRLKGVTITEASTIFENVTGRISLKTLRPSSLIFSSEMGPNPRHVLVQRYYSFLIALIGSLLTLPIMAVVALLIKFTSKGPIIYSQVRVGRRGKEFRVYKFRSMYVDAESRTGAVWATKDDPRITPIGRWIRKLRIDELPQFVNVLKGEMAIVGPRPERPEFVTMLSEMIPYYAHRHAITPGVTGWAQISHKYGDTMEDTVTKLEYDLYYLKHMSTSLDCYIIFQTVKVMLLRRGSQ